MKKTLLVALFFGATNLFAQEIAPTLINEIQALKNDTLQQIEKIDDLTNTLRTQEFAVAGQTRSVEGLDTSIGSLSRLIQTNKQNIVTNSNELGIRVKKTAENGKSRFPKLDSSLDETRWYWIIAALAILLLSGLVYWFLDKRIKSNEQLLKLKSKKLNDD